MKRNLKWILVPLALVTLAVPAVADEDAEIVKNWAAPPYSVPAGAQKSARSALAAQTPLQWVGVIPCRLADTRGNGFAGAYGPPTLPFGTLRNFQISGQCGIPAGAKAVSFNFTVAASGPGFLVVWQTGTQFPPTSTLNFAPVGQFSSNAAVVALDAGGLVSVVAGVSNADLVIDVNGYYTDLYAPNGVVNSVNTLSGALSLAAGTNISITPSGNTLTIAATAGSGGPPSGPAGGGLSGTYPNPTGSSANIPDKIVSRDASGNFEAGGIVVSGSLAFSRPPNCWQPLLQINGQPLMRACGGTFFGSWAGHSNSLGSGSNNTGVGGAALTANTNGSFNSAFGSSALQNNTGFENTAIGAGAMSENTNASGNTAVGVGALQNQNFQSGGPNWTSGNTAIGSQALAQTKSADTSTGIENTAVGAASLASNSTGFKNTALGAVAGIAYWSGPAYGGGQMTYAPMTTGNGNTFLGWGSGATSGSVVNCTAVGIEAYCDGDQQVRLGNAKVTSIGGAVAWSALSDARAKTDIRDLPVGLDFVLGLRPVAYRMKLGNGRTDMGFLAQDVEALLGDRYNVVGVGGDPDRTRTMRYTDLIAPLVKAIQEQQAMLDARNARIDELERRLTALEERRAPREESR